MIVWYLEYAADFSHDICVINTKRVCGIQTFCIKFICRNLLRVYDIGVGEYADVLLIRLKVLCNEDCFKWNYNPCEV